MMPPNLLPFQPHPKMPRYVMPRLLIKRKEYGNLFHKCGSLDYFPISMALGLYHMMLIPLLAIADLNMDKEWFCTRLKTISSIGCLFPMRKYAGEKEREREICCVLCNYIIHKRVRSSTHQPFAPTTVLQLHLLSDFDVWGLLLFFFYF